MDTPCFTHTTRDVGTANAALNGFSNTPEQTTYAYDNANRLTSRAYPAESVSDTFEPSPMILTAQSQAGHSGGKKPWPRGLSRRPPRATFPP